MTWVSHSVVTFATMFAATHNVYIAGSAMLGSTFPDRVEGPLWKFWHRSYSHWFVLYVVAMALLYTPGVLDVTGFHHWGYGTGQTARAFFFWFFTGALLHIPEDGVCGGVPLWHPAKRERFLPQLFKTGSAGEALFVIVYCMLAYVLYKVTI